MQPPTLQDVYRARQVISRYLMPTPLVRSAAMSEALGCDLYLKLETVQPIGAFKVRGGLNLIFNMPGEERARGLITASSGNHGQSIAYAAKTFGVKAIIAVPEAANPYKVAAMRRLGAEVVLRGRDFDVAREWAEEKAQREGLRYVHPANEPLLIAGVGTVSLEVMEALPDVDAIIVPIGGGSGASSHCLVAKQLSPKVKIIGVQAEKAPAVPVMEGGTEGRNARGGHLGRGSHDAGALRPDARNPPAAHRPDRARERGGDAAGRPLPLGGGAPARRGSRRSAGGRSPETQGFPTRQDGRPGHQRMQHHPGATPPGAYRSKPVVGSAHDWAEDGATGADQASQDARDVPQPKSGP